MKLVSLVAVSAILTLSSGRPVDHLHKREVPQEHSHNQFLATTDTFLFANNPEGIVDVVFGLLGDAAAAGGAGKVTDLDCLQQITADTAFTNAKAAGNITGMTAALIYRTLERNTGAVGLASVLCTQTAVNPEIQALSQHQDPASPNAATINKGIALELAKQIASIGGNPQDAIKSGTFAPGKIGDTTARGNTCDVADDPVGCIFTQNLLVPDVTEEEIQSAVASASSAVTHTAGATSTEVAAATDTTIATKKSKDKNKKTNTKTKKTKDKATSTTIAVCAATSTSSASNSASVCASAGSLGGIAPPPVSEDTSSARPFSVDGSTFLNKSAACGRACDVQHNLCADAANAGGQDFTVGDCDTQDTACKAANP